MRMYLAYGIFACVWLLLLIRVYYLSVKSNEYYEQIAQNNAIKTEQIAPNRGQILDRNGDPMAVNNLGFAILLKPHIKKENDIKKELAFLGEIFTDLNQTKLFREYKRLDSPYNQDYVPIVDFMEYERVLPYYTLLSMRSSLQVNPTIKRLYPEGNLASHVIGYVGRANAEDIQNEPLSKLTNYIGRTGIEKYYNDELQGQKGQRRIKVTALNQEIELLEQVYPTSKDLTLSIDLRLQRSLKYAFGNERAGAIIVMDAKNGEILAAASFPEYDLNAFVTGISQKEWNELINHNDHPFTNKLVNALYPPASTVKMTMAMAFFDSGIYEPESKILCDSYFALGDRRFRNWTDRFRENMSVIEALKTSCDTYFYRGAYNVGIEKISPILELFGFGRKTGVDLPNEYIGVAPSIAWKRRHSSTPWVQGDTMNTSIGQGNFLATPLQIAKNTAIFATGYELTPHFAIKIDGKPLTWDKKEILNKKQKAYLQSIRDGMIATANEIGGTAFYPLRTAGIRLAAKTGTAQIVGISQSQAKRIKEEEMEYLNRSHAWITTYGPIENPQYIVSVLVEHGAHGGSTSGPIAARVYNKLIELGYIDKSYLKPSYKRKWNIH